MVSFISVVSFVAIADLDKDEGGDVIELRIPCDETPEQGFFGTVPQCPVTSAGRSIPDQGNDNVILVLSNQSDTAGDPYQMLFSQFEFPIFHALFPKTPFRLELLKFY